MGRRPSEKQERLQVLVPGELVELVDAYARKLTKANPFVRSATRTDALKALWSRRCACTGW